MSPNVSVGETVTGLLTKKCVFFVFRVW